MLATGAVAATILHAIRSGAEPLAANASDWLTQEVDDEVAGRRTIAATVRSVVRACEARGQARGPDTVAGETFRAGYPAHWSPADIFVWESTSPAMPEESFDRSSQRDHAADRDGSGRVAAPESRSNALRRLVDDALMRTAWNAGSSRPAWDSRESWYRAGLEELQSLLPRIFGEEVALAARSVRLGFRLLQRKPLELADGERNDADRLAAFAIPSFVHREFLLVSEPPAVLSFDDQARPHSASGPFCAWRDGSALFAVHGVTVPSQFFDDPPGFGPAQIDAERNIEVRRVMLDRFGAGRYLRETDATAVNHDPRFGTLYRREIPGEEALAMVEVVNSTPEPDGTVRHYWLRVPPGMRTAREAVAWTFGLTEAEYAPAVET